MRVILGLIALVVVAYLYRQYGRRKSLSPLLPRNFDFGKRRDTLRSTLALLEERGARVLVETGVARQGLENTRGDGGSTIVFSLWASQNQAHLHAVDINSDNTARAAQAIEEYKLQDYVSLYVSDSIEFLKSFEEQVDLLYLDSYDYDKRNISIQQLSQQHHLYEFQAIESRLHENTVVLIDDCNLPGGGKGKLVIDYILSRGWKIYRYKYQAILVRRQTDQAQLR